MQIGRADVTVYRRSQENHTQDGKVDDDVVVASNLIPRGPDLLSIVLYNVTRSSR